MKVLWISSWYPNLMNPYDGDFIQRHARAVAAFTPVTVLYFAQLGEGVNVNNDIITDQVKENVREKIIFFRFHKTGWRLPDKLIYNIRYHRVFRDEIVRHFNQQGIPDLVHIHIPMKAGIIGNWIRRRWGIPFIISEQSSLYDSSAPGSFYTRAYLHRRTVKKIFHNAAAVTNVSAAVGEILKTQFGLKTVRVIHNTVNTELFFYKKPERGVFRFIHVSTLTQQKNVDGILRVIARLWVKRQDFEFRLVGPLHEGIRSMTDQHELENVVSCTGEIPYPEVAAEMQKASAMVLFSRHENFPCVIPEALCCGLPCIAAQVGGVAEAVNDKNGILVSPGDEKQLLAAMEKMMDEYDKYKRENISQEAVAKYNYGVIGKLFYDLYREVLQIH